MRQTLQQWVDTLQQHPLPALQANAQLLRQLSGNERTEMGLLATIIESDPGLSLVLLRHINQLRHKQQRNEITTPRHALMMLGLQQLRLLLPKLAIADELPAALLLRLRSHYCHAFHAACQARSWGRLRRDPDVDELFSTALLYNLGEIQLSLHATAEVDKVYALTRQQRVAPEEAQQQVFGFSFDQLSLELARIWHLPSLLCSSLQAESATMERVPTIVLARQVARIARHGWYTQAMHRLIEAIAGYLATDSAAITTQIHRTAVEAAQQSAVYGVTHPATQLLHPVPPPADQAKAKATGTGEAPVTARAKRSLDDSAATAPQARRPPAAPAPAETAPAHGHAAQREVLLRVFKALHHPDEALPFNEVIRLALEGMHHGLGLHRAVYAELEPSGARLVARQLLDHEMGAGFRRFAIELKPNNLFSRLLEKPQSLWLNDENRKRLFSLIPINLHKLIDNDSFFVMSLFADGKPAGLFYADRRSRENPLDEESYKRFKQLVTLAGNHSGSTTRE